MAVSVTYASLGELRPGSYIVIDGEPCRIVSMSRAKTGKHGSAKANVTALCLFSGSKKTLTAPVDTRVEVPIIDKRVAQVIADMGSMVQIMDMETFETIEVDKPEDAELASKLQPGVEVEYWVVMGKYMIVKVRGQKR